MTSHRFRRAAAPALLTAATLVLGACHDTLKVPPARPIGYLALNMDGDLAPTSLAPTATFFRAQGVDLPDSRSAGDQCQLTGFAPGSQQNSFPGVDAGGQVTLTLASGTATLLPSDQADGRVYALPSGTSVTIAPGETAKLDVPGAPTGFPATTFTIETVKPFEFQPVPTTTATGDVDVSWSNAGTAGVAMYLSLRYQAVGQTSVQTQVLCFLNDDGAATIPADVLTGWRSSASSSRTAVATRLRSAATTLPTNDAVLYALSSYSHAVPVTQP